MTFETFVGELKKFLETTVPEPPQPIPQFTPSGRRSKAKNQTPVYQKPYLHTGSNILYYGPNRWGGEDNPGDLCFVLKWRTGGMSGAGCWGGEAQFHESGEPEPAWIDLESTLEHFCPGITFLQWRKLERLVQHTTDNESDGYGNSDNYAVKYLKVETLLQFLNDQKLLGE